MDDDKFLVPYLAGFFDGEGHIAIGLNKNPSGKRRWYLRFAAHQVDPRPLHLLKERYGGSIQFTDRRGQQRPIYEWVATSIKAYKALKELRPFLIVKADEARLAMEFQELLFARGTDRSALSEEEEEARNKIYLAMREIKHRSYET
jgi:hypothetical protein